MEKKLFGTDGARGVANKDITCELATKMGMAGVLVLAKECNHTPRIVIGTDTRKSKDMLSFALAAGVCACGGTAIMLGVVPTPSIPIIAKALNADAAVMISASHNPMQDNGIKWFQGNGFKLSDTTENTIEQFIFADNMPKLPIGAAVGEIITCNDAVYIYENYLSQKADNYSGMKLALDCANGATSRIAPKVFANAGADLLVIADSPNGININNHCGSTHIEGLCDLVKNSDAVAGFAFDGDADRMLAVDEHGNIVDGDTIMGICAIELKNNGQLAGNTLVATVASNMGLQKSLKDYGIDVIFSDVGDRYVLEKLRENNLNFGGEQSGHCIFFDHNTTGDGTLAAILLANIMKSTGLPLSELAKIIRKYPQISGGIVVSDKAAAECDAELIQAIRESEKQLNNDGRILVRKSGTEPKLRITVEGSDDELINAIYTRLSTIVIRKYGQEA